MSSRWFNIAVILLWLTSMGWLVSTKLFPSWLVGEPPDSQRLLTAEKLEPPVGWDITWGKNQSQPLGWAVTLAQPLADDLTEVRSLIHFDRLPLRELTPEVFRPLFPDFNLVERVSVNVRTDMDFDPLGRLSRFDTSISLPGNGDTTVSQANTAVHMMGTIDGPKLALWIRIGGGKPSESSVSVPRNVMIRDAFSPQSRLPDLHEGQTWTVETYSPLQMPGNDDPKEMLYAKVEGSALLNVGDQPVDTWVVVFRSDPGSSLGSRGNERGKLWVAKDGRVLKQEAVIFDSKMTFLRQKDDKAAALARQSGMFSPKGDNRTSARDAP